MTGVSNPPYPTAMRPQSFGTVGDLEAAVMMAFSHTDGALKQQATAYCDSVRTAPTGWRTALDLFAQPESPLEARYFSLTVVDEAVQQRWDSMAPADRWQIRSTVWTWMSKSLTPSEPPYIRNKFASVLARVFKRTFLADWQSFFDDFLDLLAACPPDSQELQVRADVFLRLCLAIDEEVVNKLVPRPPEEARTNQYIKDAMRERSVPRLVGVWHDILLRYQSANPEITNLCLRVVGLYAGWVDIRLIVTPQYLSLLYQLLFSESVRVEAFTCLIDIIQKGMSPAEKMELLRTLRVAELLPSFRDVAGTEVGESVAKLVNAIGCELTGCWDDSYEVNPGIRDAAMESIQAMVPYLTSSLGDAFDDTSQAVLPFLGDYLTVLKRAKKIAGRVTPVEQESLSTLAQTIIRKMKYDEDAVAVSSGLDEEDDDADFPEFRRNLKTNLEAVCAIDPNLYETLVVSNIRSRLQALMTADGRPVEEVLAWPEAELSLYLLFQFADTLKGQIAFSLPDSGALTPLGEMMADLVQSNVASYSHNAITLMFFECVARYSSFFEQRPLLIPTILQPFVDNRGLHHRRAAVRLRVDYLFLRFLRTAGRHVIQYAELIIGSLRDLLVIRSEKSSKGSLVKVSMEAKVEWPAAFDSQLFLFESVGFLIANGSAEALQPQTRAELLQAALTPLLQAIVSISGQEAIDASKDSLPLLQSIAAIGAVCRGFPDADKADAAVLATMAPIVGEGFRYVLSALQALSTTDMWEVTRTAYQRMVNAVGVVLLPYLEPLVNVGLLSRQSPRELESFLPSLGLLIVKFKRSLFPYLDRLIWLLVQRALFYFEGTPGSETDLALRKDLRRSYLGFVSSVLMGELDDVFTSDTNKERLYTILQSVLSMARDRSDPQNQRLAFSALGKAIQCWSGRADGVQHVNGSADMSTSPGLSTSPPTKGGAIQGGAGKRKKNPVPLPLPASSNPIPGFSNYVFEAIVPAAFEAVSAPGLNLREAQSQLMVGETVQIHRIVFAKLGPEYLDFLTRVYFPSRGLPPHVYGAFVEALGTGDVKPIRAALETTFAQRNGR